MKILFYLVIIISSLNLFAQQEDETKINTNNSIDLLGAKINPYGSFRFRVGTSQLDAFEVGDFLSRIGLEGKASIDKKSNYFAITKVEFGLNLVNRDDNVHISTDPGHSVTASVNSAFYSRIAYGGLSTPYGDILAGKNWGIYYDITSVVDYMNHFGGDAIGSWNAGTDGGVSGTGRAENVLQYRLNKGKFFFGAQTQLRKVSYNDKKFADTYGLGIKYKTDVFSVGMAYNEVLDGVPEDSIQVGQAIEGDKIAAFAVSYSKKQLLLSAVVTQFYNHEKTDLGKYYSGNGFEFHAGYFLNKNKTWLMQASYNLMLSTDELTRDYQMSFISSEIVYEFKKNSILFVTYKYDLGVDTDQSRYYNSVLLLGFHYSFGY